MPAPRLLWIVLVCVFAGVASAAPTNVIFILTDNHGAWTLGCYGNQEIRSPNIDQLSAEGIRFDNAFAVNPVCSPNRATLLTGLMPSQHGVHCFLVGGRHQTGPDARNTIGDFETLPEVLRDAGYACGLVGKWHLGGNLTPQSGFDDYWITMPHGGTSTFYDAPIIQDGKVRRHPGYLTDLWTDHAAQFVRTQVKREKPFFLLLSYNGPYCLGNLLLDEGRNQHVPLYAEQSLDSFPRSKPHAWQFNNKDFQNNPVSIRRVAAEVTGVDDGVGRISKLIEELGIEEETLIVFTADQGWSGGHGGFFGMGDHTRPFTVTDPMMQVPMIWKQKGAINPRTDSRLTSHVDFMPTLLGYLGLKTSSNAGTGKDYSSDLRRATPQIDSSDAVFFEFENLRSIRTPQWKLVRRFPNGPDELFHLDRDPGESKNCIERYPNEAKALSSRLDEHFNRMADPKYDLWNGGTSQTRMLQPIQEAYPTARSVERPQTDKAFEPIEFDVPEGYEVQVAAGPPLVKHPMMAAFDDRGRLFVAESAGLNLKTKDLEEQLPNSILLLEDIDGDGCYDKRTTFADNMTLPMGAQWFQGSLYVASPPNIWKLTDVDGDGIAEQREILVSQFGYSGNAASVHGCFLSPTGRLFWCDGRHGHEVRSADGTLVSEGSGSYIFSCRPDGSDVRAHCGGGMDNPVEVDFTPTGDVLGTVNILKHPPREDCLVHWLHGGTYPHSERVLNEFPRTGDLLEPVHSFGHVGVSGLTRYRSGVLDRQMRNDVLVTVFNTGEVVRCSWIPEGSSYRAQATPWVKAKTPDCHPTDVLEAADGSVLIVDTGGWFRIGCPTSQIAKPEVPGAIYRLTRSGTSSNVDPWGNRIDWNTLDTSQLVRLLYDTRHHVRHRAVEQCVLRGEEVVPALGRVAMRLAYPEGRHNALWALGRIQSPSAQAIVRQALEHRFAPARKIACQIFSESPDTLARDSLVNCLQDSDPHVRRVAAKALGRLKDPYATQPLLKALSSVVDRAEEHAIIFALLECGDYRGLASALHSDEPSVRLASLIALRQEYADQISAERVIALLKDQESRVREAALDFLLSREQWVSEVASYIQSEFERPLANMNREVWVALVASFLRYPDVADFVAAELKQLDSEVVRMGLLISALGNAESLAGNQLTEPLIQLLKSGNVKRLPDVIAAASKLGTPEINKALTQLSVDTTTPDTIRLASLSVLQGRLSEGAFQYLIDLLNQPQAGPLHGRVLRILAARSLSAPQLLALTKCFSNRSSLQCASLLQPYARSREPEVGIALIEALEREQVAGRVSETQLTSIIGGYGASVQQRAVPLKKQLQAYEQELQARLDQWAEDLPEGESARGESVFKGSTAQCANCHAAGNSQRQQLGPSLAGIGRIRSRRDLLEAILFPSKSFAREYEPYQLLTLSGQSYNGLLLQQGDAKTVVLQPTNGDPIRVSTDEIELLRPSSVSVMPQGLHEKLTRQELADLVAYLQSLR